jgi:hypothetical protein
MKASGYIVLRVLALYIDCDLLRPVVNPFAFIEPILIEPFGVSVDSA